jgi:uncharacterized protein
VLASKDDSGRSLTAVMVAHNDPGSYGDLEEVVVTAAGSSENGTNARVDGPLQAAEKISTYQPVSQYQTVVGQRGSSVQFGNLLVLPFGNSLMYVRPVYARQENNGLNTLQRVAVTSGNDVGFGETLAAAIDDMFSTDQNGQPKASGTTTPDSTTTTVPGSTTAPPGGSTPEDLLAQADSMFTQADAALAKGDLGEYQRLITEGRKLVQQASGSLGAAGAGGSPTDSTTTTTMAGNT